MFPSIPWMSDRGAFGSVEIRKEQTDHAARLIVASSLIVTGPCYWRQQWDSDGRPTHDLELFRTTSFSSTAGIPQMVRPDSSLPGGVRPWSHGASGLRDAVVPEAIRLTQA